MAQDKLDKWSLLKLWVGRRHDYFEAQYKATNFSADSAEMGAYRAVFQAMKDIDEQEMIAQSQAQARPTTPPEAGRGR